ncbi:MAG: ABC transporter ATP-binding protein/permease, partial [Lachnospiraceae bacterium]|nr:ABC transporter ATP-binding protein/permease [Lachnospiraceae bacterium]
KHFNSAGKRHRCGRLLEESGEIARKERQLFYYIRKAWKNNVMAILLTIVCDTLQIAASLLLIQGFQSIIEWNLRKFLCVTFIQLVCWLLNFLFSGIENYFEFRAIRTMNNAVRRDIAATMAAKEYREFHKLDIGEHISQFSNDIERIENLAWNSFYSCVECISNIILSIIAIAAIHWSLLLAAVINTLLMTLAPKIFNNNMASLGAACAREQAAGLNHIKDASEGFDVLSLFGKKERFVNQISEGSDAIEKPKFRLNYIKSFSICAVQCVNLSCQILSEIWVGLLILNKFILPGAIGGLSNIVGRLSNALGNMAAYKLSIAASRTYFDKITQHHYNPVNFAASSVLPITMENISFQYGENHVLRNISLAIQKGGKYALTGPSGCGKSTLLKLLLGWLPDYSGTILFGGKNAKELNIEQIQRQISCIEQDVYLFNATIRDNITLGDDFTDAQLAEAVRNSALSADLEHMSDGLDTAVGENGSALSGGQKQRIAIARALIHGCQLLLVDEGTSALDQANADIVEEHLLANPDLTLLLISHHLSDERKKQFTKVYDLGVQSPLNSSF